MSASISPNSFEHCKFGQELYQAAAALVSQIHQVLVLYLGLHGEPLTIRALLRLTDDDDIIGRRLYDTVSMNVYVRLDGFFLLRRPGASALMCFLGQPQIPPSQQCYP